MAYSQFTESEMLNRLPAALFGITHVSNRNKNSLI